MLLMDIVSDRDLKFASNVGTEVFKRLETKWVNHMIQDMLLESRLCSKEDTKREQYLHLLDFAYNNSKHTLIRI